MTVSQKTLTILRHAKAETGLAGQDDHDRGLNERGVKAARLIGQYLADKHIRPDRVFCSTAKRAHDTWKYLQDTYKQKLPVEYSEKLYLASGNEILKFLSAVPETAKHVLLVGHNPGFHQLALKLARKGDEDLLDTLSLKFPTCAMATFSLETKWHDVQNVRGTLADFITPKMLGGKEED